MKYKILIIFALFCFSPLLKAQDQNIVLKTETGDLDGTLLTPKKSKKIPLVILISGSGPTDRNGNNPQMKNNSLKMLAEALCENGIATLRFDKRGVAESTMALDDEANIRFETYINDVCSWVDLAAEKKQFSKIFIAGHSEGSLIGMVATQKCPQVSGFISISGAGYPADEILRKQLKAQLSEDFLIQANAMIDTLKLGKTLQFVPADFFVLFRPSVQPYLISWFRFNPQREISVLKVPTLLINGGHDIQVETDNLAQLQENLPEAESVIIYNMNHVLKDCKSLQMKDQYPTYSNPNIPINANLSDIISGFVHRNNQ